MIANGSTVLAYGTWVIYVRNEIKVNRKTAKITLGNAAGDYHARINFHTTLMLFSPILKTLTGTPVRIQFGPSVLCSSYFAGSHVIIHVKIYQTGLY